MIGGFGTLPIPFPLSGRIENTLWAPISLLPPELCSHFWWGMLSPWQYHWCPYGKTGSSSERVRWAMAVLLPHPGSGLWQAANFSRWRVGSLRHLFQRTARSVSWVAFPRTCTKTHVSMDWDHFLPNMYYLKITYFLDCRNWYLADCRSLLAELKLDP